MDTAEITARNVKLSKYGEVSWRGHLWNFHTKERGAANLTEYQVEGTGPRIAPNLTGLAVRHEYDGTWTARVDGTVLQVCRTKLDAQMVIEADWLGVR